MRSLLFLLFATALSSTHTPSACDPSLASCTVLETTTLLQKCLKLPVQELIAPKETNDIKNAGVGIGYTTNSGHADVRTSLSLHAFSKFLRILPSHRSFFISIVVCALSCSCACVFLHKQLPPLKDRRPTLIHIMSLLCSVFLSDAIDAMTMVHYPAAAMSWGLSEAMIGAVIAAGYLPAVFGGPLAVVLAKYANHREKIAIGLSLGALSNLVLCAVPSLAHRGVVAGLCLSVVARIIWGCGSLLVNMASMAAAGEAYETDQSWAIGMVNAANGLAYTFGPLLGAALFTALGFEQTCLLPALALAIVLFPVCCSIPQGKETAVDVQESAASLFSLVRVPSVVPVLLGVLLVGIGFASIDATMEVELVQFDTTSSFNNVFYAGIVLSTLSLCNAVASPLVGAFAAPTRFGARATISFAFCFLSLAGGAASALCAVSTSYITRVVAVTAACGIWGIGSAMIVVPAMDFISNSAGLHNLNSVAALMLTALNMGTIFGSSLGSLCAARFGLSAMFGILAASSVCLGLLLIASGSRATSGLQRREASFSSDFPSMQTSPCMLPYLQTPGSPRAPATPPAMQLPEPAVPYDVEDLPSAGGASGNSSVLLVLFLSMFLSAEVDAMPMVYYPKEATSWGFDESMTGLVISSGYMPIVFCGRLATEACSRFGHRLTLVLGLALGACGSLVFLCGPILSTQSTVAAFVLSIVARLMQGAGALMVNVSATVVAAALYESDRSWAVGTLQVGNELAYTVGPILGAFLYTLLGFELVCALCSGAFCICILPAYQLVKDVNELKDSASMLDMIRYPSVFVTLLLVLLVGMGFSSIQATTELALDQLDSTGLHNDVAFAGVILFAMSVCSAAAAPGVGWLAAPRNLGASAVLGTAPWILTCSAAAGAVILAASGLSYATRIVLLTAAVGAWGLGAAMVIAPTAEFIALVVSAQGLEEAAALMFAALNAGSMLGASVGLYCASHWGFWSPNGLLAGFSAVVGMSWLACSRGAVPQLPQQEG